MIIKKGKKERKEEELCGLISARLLNLSAARMLGLYALQHAS